ncbi:MAG: ABC transporter permease [Bacteroidota bacterium]
MNKIWLIIKREYRTRVRNKTFLLSTFLLPVAMVAIILGAAFLAVNDKDKHKIAVSDPNGFFKDVLKGEDLLVFEFPEGVDSTNYQKKGYTDLLIVPRWDGHSAMKYDIRSPKQLGLDARRDVEKKINKAIDDKMMMEFGLSNSRLDSIRKLAPKAEVNELSDSGSKSKVTSSGVSFVVGLASGMLIYIMMFIYGAQVMRGVMEEKTNRIAEVVVSSVKPFQLMMGKIIGIGGVGLTQFLLWLVLIFGLFTVAQIFIPQETLAGLQQVQQNTPMSGGGIVKAASTSQNIIVTLSNINWFKIIPFFLFYFLGGYLFYAALFAAVGCMVNEDPQDAQSLMLPIMMPIIFGFIIMQGAIQNPNSSMAVWGSIVPFTSPIVMMARIPSDPPLWQVALSMILLIGGSVGTGWMAGKIYRTGILMYGKKGSWKQMMKWVFAKS